MKNCPQFAKSCRRRRTRLYDLAETQRIRLEQDLRWLVLCREVFCQPDLRIPPVSVSWRIAQHVRLQVTSVTLLLCRMVVGDLSFPMFPGRGRKLHWFPISSGLERLKIRCELLRVYNHATYAPHSRPQARAL